LQDRKPSDGLLHGDSFQAFDIALDLVRSLREPLARIATRDADLDSRTCSVDQPPRAGRCGVAPQGGSSGSAR
jgi:hypothetical protein